jgi:DNA invertase Pin-like site-specific DNA recombinase
VTVAVLSVAVAVRAGIYARISSDRDGDALGVRRQIADCERLAERKGWEIVEQYTDDDASAWSGRTRPEYRRCLDDLASGRLNGLLVYDLDRLHRQPRELEAFIDLCRKLGLTNVTSVAGDIDLTTPEGQFQARILGAVAAKESEDKSRRIQRKHEELAQAGKVSGGGSRPYGYDDDKLTVRESEAVVIRECVARLLAGEALRSISTDLTRRGIRTSTGAEWAPTSLGRTLQRPRYAGQRDRKGEIVSKAEWPAIISPTDSARVRALLSDPERRTNKVARRYLLVRLLRCGYCGETLVSRPKQGGARAYQCVKGPGFSGCGRLSVMAEPLEQFVVEAVLYRLDTPELAAALAGEPGDPDAERWQAEVDQSRAELDEIAAMHGRREISLSEWRAAREPVERRITDAKKELGRLNRTSALAGHVGNADELRGLWETLPLTRQHAIVAAVLDHVTVAPGRRGFNGFDSGRFTPVWKL